MNVFAPDDRELIRRAARGDDDAFRLLVRAVLPRLRRWALALTGDPDEADETVQRTLIAMHRALPSFRAEAKLSTWLYRILANAARDQARSGARRRAVPLERIGEAVDGSPDPARPIDAARLAAAVRDLMEVLPPKQREVAMLVDQEGMRPAEVAEALDMNPVTVRAHLFKARRALRARILERYPELMEGYTS